jgi:hypothetical protein
VLPICFVAEGVHTTCFALDLNSSELILVSCILSAIKGNVAFHPLFLGVLCAAMLVLSVMDEDSNWILLWQHAFVLVWLNCYYFLDCSVERQSNKKVGGAAVEGSASGASAGGKGKVVGAKRAAAKRLLKKVVGVGEGGSGGRRGGATKGLLK